MEEQVKASPVKIASLELENVKRVRALALEPKRDGLTVIGGRNGQGKTSVLDAIAWALGGDRLRPDRPTREGSATPAKLRVTLSNGLTVERTGARGSLKVTDPAGTRAGQQLINGLIEELALNLPKFMAMSDRDKANELLQIVGVGDELDGLDAKLKRARDRRLAVGQEKRAKRKVAEDAPYHPEAPDRPVSAAELIAEQQGVMARNAENAAKRNRAAEIGRDLEAANARVEELERRAAEIAEELARNRAEAAKLADDAVEASKSAADLVDESTAEVEAKLAEIDELNERVRANQRRAEMRAEADALDDEYRALDERVAEIEAARAALLEGADLPLPGLSVEDGRLTYNGAAWGEMSGAEQLRVATAIVRRLKPSCGFVLVDELEKMDPVTLAEFGAWAEGEGLQVIGTRVAVDGSCTVVIEDGRDAASAPAAPQPAPFSMPANLPASF